MLKEIFLSLVRKYATDDRAVELWLEIEKAYSSKKRHYHTLTHLENLLAQLTAFKHLVAGWETILFSLFYHDVVYNVLMHNNEEESALMAEQRMTAISVPVDNIQKCKEQILATKSHQTSADNDTNLFTDADLSILGSDWSTYQTYARNVRKEYAIYPDLIYNPGRKKVLAHFLAMEPIFKTNVFRGNYELQAKENMNRELRELTTVN